MFKVDKVSNYQNFNGEGRDCERRYEIMKPHIPQDAGIAVLDVGSNMGFFSQKIAEDFKSLVYSFEHRKLDFDFHRKQLLNRGITNNYIFKTMLDKDIMSELHSGDEVFDVTLLLSVVHHFYYPYEIWCKMVGGFVDHSKYTFFELPSLEDEPDIASVDTFWAWYGKYEDNVYEQFLEDMLKTAGLADHCTVTTLDAGIGEGSSKETRAIVLVENKAIDASRPRYHAIPIAACKGIYMAYPQRKLLREVGKDFMLWAKRQPSRVVRLFKRLFAGGASTTTGEQEASSVEHSAVAVDNQPSA